jgi:APA family basic amino acid/polyamine antiporter
MNGLFARKPLSLLHEELWAENRLRRALGPVALTSLGIGCIIGAGIFVLTGLAAHDKAGPSLIVSFVVAGFACALAALSYAEFAALTPVAGSAYTYAYATVGELFAWIIGWDLGLEYTVAASAVAHGWSKYAQNFMGMFGIKLPTALSTAPFDVNPEGAGVVATGGVFDLMAVAVIAVLVTILVLGIRESAGFNTAMVVVKVGIVLLVIAVGAFYVRSENWHPFAPYGWTGLNVFGKHLLGQTDASGAPLGTLAGAAVIFFAYIGFDSVSTHAEEARNPQRDVPIGIIASLAICTVLYIAVSAVLTGMVPYREIDIEAPVAEAFAHSGLRWAQFVISLGAVAGITSVLLVLMLSQPRVLLAMARDGLLPEGFFGAVHPRFRTPYKATLLTGLVVALMTGFLPLGLLAELVNIGTLLAFSMVCVAVLIMRKTNPDAPRPFRCPLVPYVPILGVVLCVVLMFSLPPANWLRLLVWLVVGLVVYAGYGRHHSKLRQRAAALKATPSGESGEPS